ncbi:MAG: sigma-70 family RNA polymerase sigma factor [Acidobacteriota bacterium]
MNDEDIVAAVLAGREDSFSELVQRYQGRLVNYLYRMLRNVDEAHDLTQDVFFKVYQALDSFNPRYRFSTWLFRIAQNAAIDHMRKRRLKVVSLQRPDPEGGADQEWEMPSSDRGPYGDLRNLERGDAIQQAIDQLPWEYRELILLRHYGELSYDEIATAKEMPLGTVKNKLFRGRQMLKAKLSDYLVD